MTKHGLTLEERFWLYVDRKSDVDCWNWMGGKDGFGYGMLNIGIGYSKSYRSHRYSWVLFNGKIPIELSVLHKCDNPSCVNPNHLFLGTDADNAHDRDRKGRQISHCGEQHGCSKLTNKDVLEIRNLRKQGVSYPIMQSIFNMSRTQLWKIITRRSWSYLK